MSDRGKILIGLVLFVVVATYPIWRAFGADAPAPPDLAKPVSGTECVEDAAWMKANHAPLLDQWRHAVIRDGQREYTSTSGRRYEMSLSKTCMRCHENQQTFCNKCHDYVNVEPKCWQCHLDPSREVGAP